MATSETDAQMLRRTYHENLHAALTGRATTARRVREDLAERYKRLITRLEPITEER